MMAPVVGRFMSQCILGSAGDDDPLRALSTGRFAAGRLIPEGQVV